MSSRIFPVPRRALDDALAAADARRDIRTPQHADYESALETFGQSVGDMLGMVVAKAPAQVRLCVAGLVRGAYVVGDEGAWLVHEIEPAPKPIASPDQARVAISYNSHDRDVALQLFEVLEDAGCRPFIIDVEADRDDPVWWLRFRVAMSVCTHFIPLVSANYTRGVGAQAELEELRSHLDALADHRVWYPMLPAILEEQPFIAEIPSLSARGDQDRRAFALWVRAILDAEDGDPKPLRSWLDLHAVSKGVDRWDLDGAGVEGAGNALRLVRRRRPCLVHLRERRSPDAKGELRAMRLAKEGRYEEAAVYLIGLIQQEGTDASLLIALANNLGRAGFARDALVVWREAKRWLNAGHTQSTFDQVESGIEQLADHAPFARHGIGDVFASRGSEVAPPPYLAFETTPRAAARLERCGGVKELLGCAYEVIHSGDFEFAEEVSLAAHERTVAPGNRARFLHVAAVAAASLGAINRATWHVALGLEHAPDHSGLLELAEQLAAS